jgi:1-acyl-sn-glycerol-3-phosphate acyltransferase
LPVTPEVELQADADTAAAPESLAGTLRLVLRTPLLIVLLICGLLFAALVNADFTGRIRPEPLAQWWCRRLLSLLGLRLEVRGSTLGHVIVANHVSWLDIPLICACVGTRFVSKSEVRHWPVAGWLANAAGTFYLRRGQGGSKPLLAKLIPHLQDGGSVVIFPEGTTTDGEQVLPFHARLFAAAIESATPVQAVALRYGRTDDGSAIAPFVGDDDLVSHLLRLLRNRGLDVELSFAPPLDPAGQSREQLAEAARASVVTALGLRAV